ncbi:hypothetical protein [Streptomyces clavuligerus]|nr:hypothetical protein [Streptomyces clavuligerus]MBY6307423.1 hypothetical protein [Streptomyces clavuligerus]QCS10017.1 hypothetical protein CRV15_31030 [Streptomyces clavuligerus]QPJ97938.1 hypothetical protein GE265_33415 [Streptomyces clavuligerus]WDN56723.1 hypothetical protein LL058_33460 [Streptomyces clavuligerus]
MVFDNIFGFASTGAGLFSVTTDGTKPQPGAGVDFEDADDATYDDTSTSLFPNGIHGASSRAKVVQEQSPEARAVLGFLGSFIQTTQTSAGAQAQYAGNPGSVSSAASAGMRQSSTTVTEHGDLQKDEDLQTMPRKSDFNQPPKAPPTPEAQAPKASKPTAEDPSKK